MNHKYKEILNKQQYRIVSYCCDCTCVATSKSLLVNWHQFLLIIILRVYRVYTSVSLTHASSGWTLLVGWEEWQLSIDAGDLTGALHVLAFQLSPASHPPHPAAANYRMFWHPFIYPYPVRSGKRPLEQHLSLYNVKPTVEFVRFNRRINEF